MNFVDCKTEQKCGQIESVCAELPGCTQESYTGRMIKFRVGWLCNFLIPKNVIQTETAQIEDR